MVEDLFAHARRSDPQTSHDAAAAVTPKLNELQRKVENYAGLIGSHGFTDAEMAEYFESTKSTLRTRRAELAERNIIVDSGKTRTFGDSPRQRIVWIHRDFAKNPPPVREPAEKDPDQRKRVGYAIACALWGRDCADLYFNPRYASAPDIRLEQALRAADAAMKAM